MRLDAHQHFWKFNTAEYSWIQPTWPIRRDFLPDDLRPLLARTGFDGCIAVQARQNLQETRWLLALADEYSFVKGVVGWVDLRSDRVEHELEDVAKHPGLAGVRHVVQDEPDDDFMLQPNFMRGIGKLKRFNLTYDILIKPRQLPAAIKLTQRFGDQPFVIDHLAKPEIKKGKVSPWREQMFEIAKQPNVFCKVSGMVTEASWTDWKAADFRPYLDVVFEAFGVDRLMFGSDWPVCLLAGTYENVFGIIQEYLPSLPDSAKAKIMGENAARFYLRRKRGIP
jgi:L-fuconolactonase